MPAHARGGELNTTSHAAVMPLLALKSVINCGRSLRLLFTTPNVLVRSFLKTPQHRGFKKCIA